MARLAGFALRLVAFIFFALEWICAAIILGIFSYFLAKLSAHDAPIIDDWRAVEGLSGATVLYTMFAMGLTFFLAGKRFFAMIGIILDLCFCGASIAIAVLTKDGADSCNGIVDTPVGTGPSNSSFFGLSLHTACILNTVCFAVAIINAFLFVISAFLQIIMVRHAQKEKKYGPSPANNYTSGSGNRKKMFGIGRKQKTTGDAYATKDAEMSGASYTTDTTVDNRYGATTAPQTTDAYGTPYTNGTTYQSATGYQTGPTATTANPYGYSTTHPTGTAVNY